MRLVRALTMNLRSVQRWSVLDQSNERGGGGEVMMKGWCMKCKWGKPPKTALYSLQGYFTICMANLQF